MSFERNLAKLRALAERKGLKALALFGKGNISYATGLREPSGALVLSATCGDYLLVPLLDYHRVQPRAPRELSVKAFYRGGEEQIKSTVPESDLIVGGLADAVKRVLSGCSESVGIDAASVSVPLYRALEQGLRLEDVSGEIARVRSIKEDWEIELIERSLRIAERAMREGFEALAQGVSELEVAGAIAAAIRRAGGWGEAFPTIVAFYDNTALPHHTPEGLRLTLAGPVLIDMGVSSGGYVSDITRTSWWGSGGSEFKARLEALQQALGAAVDRIAPGVEAWEPDKEARLVLERHGLLRYFNHGLGHGVGVEVHEEPYLRPGSATLLEPGMVVTVEPGFYVPGLYGARIEDMVLVTPRGRRVLTSFSRILA